MGSISSGRHGRFGRPPARWVVESCLSINIKEWNRKGWCKVGETEATMQRRYEDGSVTTQTQAIAWTNCNYGGQRPWFVCPRCQNRAGRLFQRILFPQLSPFHELNSIPFQCRKCLNLTYGSSNSSGNRFKEHSCRIARIRKKLKATCWNPRTDEIPAKPKYMRWRVYYGLIDEFRELERAFWEQSWQEIKKLTGAIGTHSDHLAALARATEKPTPTE